MNEFDILNALSQIQSQVNSLPIEQSASDGWNDLKFLMMTLSIKIFAAIVGVVSLRIVLNGFDKRLGLDFKKFFEDLPVEKKIEYIRWRLIATSIIVYAAIN